MLFLRRGVERNILILVIRELWDKWDIGALKMSRWIELVKTR